jgi:hypothetical protein
MTLFKCKKCGYMADSSILTIKSTCYECGYSLYKHTDIQKKESKSIYVCTVCGKPTISAGIFYCSQKCEQSVIDPKKEEYKKYSLCKMIKCPNFWLDKCVRHKCVYTAKGILTAIIENNYKIVKRG